MNTSLLNRAGPDPAAPEPLADGTKLNVVHAWGNRKAPGFAIADGTGVLVIEPDGVDSHMISELVARPAA